jgi:hypothetical protein
MFNFCTVVDYQMTDIDGDFKTSSEQFLVAESKMPTCIHERLLIRRVDKMISGDIS